MEPSRPAPQSQDRRGLPVGRHIDEGVIALTIHNVLLLSKRGYQTWLTAPTTWRPMSDGRRPAPRSAVCPPGTGVLATVEDRQRDPPEDAVAAVGVAEGSGGLYASSHGRPLHGLSDPLPGYAQHGPTAVLGVKRRQVGQALEQVRGDRDLAALARGASGWTLITGGSWLSRRSLRRRDSASETLSPVLSMILKAMRVG